MLQIVEPNVPNDHLTNMPKRAKKTNPPTNLIHEWPLPAAVTLGSGVRMRGVLLEVRAHLPMSYRKLLDVETGALILRIPVGDCEDYSGLVETVSRKLDGIEALPIIPREVEDILSIKTSERRRWLEDGRLKSAGTRTVKLRGRARAITFHVHDPRHIEDLLDRNAPEVWREEDALSTAANRRRAAGKAALTRAGRKPKSAEADRRPPSLQAETGLEGWEDFDLAGLLR